MYPMWFKKNRERSETKITPLKHRQLQSLRVLKDIAVSRG